MKQSFSLVFNVQRQMRLCRKGGTWRRIIMKCYLINLHCSQSADTGTGHQG